MSIQAEKPRKSRSLAATLTIAFLGLSIGVLLISNISQIVSTIRIQQRIIANQQQLIAQDAANAVSNFVQEKFKVLESAIELGDLTSKSPEDQETILENILGFERAIQHLVLLTPEGEQLTVASRLSLSASEKASQLDNETKAALIAKTQSGEHYLSPVYVDSITSEPYIVVAVPVNDVFGDFRGILMAQVNLKFMWDLVDRLEIGENGQAYVVDRLGNLIAFRDVTRILGGENVSYVKEVNEFINSTGIVDENPAGIAEGIDGTTAAITYVPLGVPDWAVVTELPFTEAYQEVFQGLFVSIVVLLASSLLAGLMGAFVARRLSVPLVDLTSTAEKVAEGNLNLSAKVEGPTEVISLAEAFNMMTSQLRVLIGSLEQQVTARTQALETTSEVSRRLSTILNQDQLVREVVEQLRSAFGYYHAHIYLYDQEKQILRMAGGTGDAGRAMLARGHAIEKGRGLVGRAAEINEIVLIPDVALAEGWLPNPLLPETKAEVAVPIAIGAEVLGVLDVQHNITGGLTQQDAELIQAIANQVAIAVQNAQVYERTQRQAIREAQVVAISQRIQSANTIDDVLKVAIHDLSQTLGAQRSSVELRIGSQHENGRE